MRDNHDRIIDYARVSITDRCNLRCIYCMPEEGVEKLSHLDILSYEDIIRVCRCFAKLGIQYIKITGGEPLLRANVQYLIRKMKQVEGIEQVTLTTNGLLLARQAEDLRAAGLDGVNISLDAVDPELYRRLTRWGDIESVLEAIDAAVAAGLPMIKINCVPINGRNEKELVKVALLAMQRDIQVRFIEMMPIGLGARFAPIDNRRVRALLEEEYGQMTPFVGEMGNGPATYGTFPGFRGKIGFISALGNCFCARCNRIRLTADGEIKNCLHTDGGISLSHALRQPDDALLLKYIRSAIIHKPERHDFLNTRQKAGGRIMSRIGG